MLKRLIIGLLVCLGLSLSVAQAQMPLLGTGPGAGGAGNSVSVPYATNYNRNSYNAYGALFDTTGLTKGVDYDLNWTIKPSVFPNQVTADWYVPRGTVPTGVWGYFHVDYNTNRAVPLSNITALTTNFDWSYTGTPNFNLLVEFWLARGVDAPVWTTNQAIPNASYYEIGLFLHCPDYSFHNGGVLIGTTHTNNGVVYTARQNGRYITFARQSENDGLTGSFDWKAALDYLVFNEAITGSEWAVNYLPLFGIEPTGLAGSGTYGGTLAINSLSTTYAAGTSAPSADYVGTNGVLNPNDMTNWDVSNQLTLGSLVSDMDGGTSARELFETAQTSNHEFIKTGAFVTVDSREMDYMMLEDVRADKGRTKFRLFVANSDFTSQIGTGFDTTAETVSADTLIGSGLTVLNSQVIDMGNGWYRLLHVFRKAAGLTQIFYDFGVKDASGNTSYLGDITKGVTLRVRHRLLALPKITVTGTPLAGSTGVAYSFVPTIRGGKSPLACTFVGGTGLPSGWGINSTTCEISGTTAVAGTVTGTVRVTGNDGVTGDLPVSIAVTSAPLTTYDPATSAAGVTLSEGNRRITNVASNLGARTTSSRSAGTVYYEVNVVAGGAGTIGAVNVSGILNNWMSQNANGIGLDSAGSVFSNGTNQGSAGIGTVAAGNIIGIEINFTTGKITFAKNNVWSASTWNIPTGALYGASQPASGSHRIATETSQFTYAPRGGASPWN